VESGSNPFDFTAKSNTDKTIKDTLRSIEETLKSISQ